MQVPKMKDKLQLIRWTPSEGIKLQVKGACRAGVKSEQPGRVKEWNVSIHRHRSDEGRSEEGEVKNERREKDWMQPRAGEDVFFEGGVAGKSDFSF